MAKGKNVHVVPTENGRWGVRSENNQRLTKVVDTQKEAIAIGRGSAIGRQSELFIHGKNGQFRERNSYGNDPESSVG